MRIKNLLLIVALGITNILLGQFKDQNLAFDQFILKGMTDWKIPGMVVVVVKDGKPVFRKSYGIKDIDTKEKVNDQTLFNMASTTKAIVAIAMGILVDEGKVSWDDKVQKYLPEFRLSDTYIASEATVKDLFTHNLGIGNADGLWIFDSLSTSETLERFAFAEKEYSLRSSFIYQNIMYAAAGEIIGKVSGVHWSEFVDKRIFEPLKMMQSASRSIDILKMGNYTTPHYDDIEEGIVKVSYSFSDQIGAAGMIWSCAEDMEKYLMFLTNNGVVNKDTLIKQGTFEFLFQPQTLIPSNQFYPTQTLTKPNWMSYGLGWFQHDYKGEKVDFHTGSLSGLVAINGMIRKHGLAVYVLENLDHAELRHAIMYKAFDLYALGGDRDWHQEIFDMYEKFRLDAIDALEKDKRSRVEGTSPSLPLETLAGTYFNNMLGRLTVEVSGKNLLINFNDFQKYEASHWHYNTFQTNKDPKWRFNLKLDFILEGDKYKSVNVLGSEFIKELKN